MVSESVEINDDTVLVHHPACFVREEDEEGGFLFNADTGKVYLLNFSAVQVWNLLDGKRTVAGIVAELQASYTDLAPEVCQQVLGHLEMMRSFGAVGTVGA
jgi:hypothetical protein